MSKFEKSIFKVNEEVAKPANVNQVKADTVGTPVVREFEINPIKRMGQGEYSAVKAKYGALAATDSDRPVRNQRDRRFSLNSLLRDPLSVEQEEQRAIEERVQARVDTMVVNAKELAAEVGYKEGLRIGYEEAFRKVREEAKSSLQRFDQLVNEAENAKKEIFKANERFLIELVFRIAKSVILRDLSDDPEYILRIATELVERVGVRDNLKIRIHTEDAKTIDMLKGGLEKTYGTLNNLTIESSNQVPQGSCLVETEWNAIEARVEDQLQAIYGSLTGKGVG